MKMMKKIILGFSGLLIIFIVVIGLMGFFYPQALWKMEVMAFTYFNENDCKSIDGTDIEMGFELPGDVFNKSREERRSLENELARGFEKYNSGLWEVDIDVISKREKLIRFKTNQWNELSSGKTQMASQNIKIVKLIDKKWIIQTCYTY